VRVSIQVDLPGALHTRAQRSVRVTAVRVRFSCAPKMRNSVEIHESTMSYGRVRSRRQTTISRKILCRAG